MTDKELFVKFAKEKGFEVKGRVEETFMPPIKFKKDGREYEVDIIPRDDTFVFNLWCKVSVEYLSSDMLIAEERNLEQIEAIIENLL